MKLMVKRSSALLQCATILGARIINKPPLMPEMTRQKTYQLSGRPEKAQLSKLTVPENAAKMIYRGMVKF
ncbi:hypothetical protein D3C75_1149110 [compost metagenome]